MSSIESYGVPVPVTLDKLVASPAYDVRKKDDPSYQNHVAELALSITNLGVREPLKVLQAAPVKGKQAPKTYIIVNGHTRYEACLSLDYKGTVPVQVIGVEGDKEAEIEATAMMVYGNQGNELTGVALADAFLSLRARGLSQADIARRAGVSEATVSNYIRTFASEKIRQAVRLNLLAPTIAAKIVNQQSSEVAEAIADKAIKDNEAYKESAARDEAPAYFKREIIVAVYDWLTNEILSGGMRNEKEILSVLSGAGFNPKEWYRNRIEAQTEETEKVAKAEAKKLAAAAKKVAIAAKGKPVK